MEDRAIDIVAWRMEPKKLVAVEAKVRDWAKGLRQANLTRLCSDYSYLAVPSRALSAIDCGRAERMGVGILLVDRTVREYLAPRYSRIQHPSLYSAAMKGMRGARHG